MKIQMKFDYLGFRPQRQGRPYYGHVGLLVGLFPVIEANVTVVLEFLTTAYLSQTVCRVSDMSRVCGCLELGICLGSGFPD